MEHMIAVGGPTASGKTALAIALAKRFDGEIISADSRQCYRGMDIGTAKPTASERAMVPHHGIDMLDLGQQLSAGAFETFALATHAEIAARGKKTIVCGGSGLYLEAFLRGIHTFPEIPQEVKARVDIGYAEGGVTWLATQVAELDPVCYARIDRQNPARLRRALEVCLATGKPYSSFLDAPQAPRPFRATLIMPSWPREVLYERIDARVDQMLAEGLEEEVRSLLPFRAQAAMHTIGYEEWFPYFDGLASRAEVIDKIKQHSRNYAKRQLTWFKKYGSWVEVDGADFISVLGVVG
jgi:tRNA dimethylallyltransferase